ncbi:hypothetical protein ACQP0C_13655 [Nocardia sp. CA-129566]|uniref:hypothetical protein n=1 Tax=Nocardia sp. CA-129566 TaxID=3239976 RepID=UPI003D986B68
MPIELHRGDPLDRVTAPHLADAVIALRRDELAVVHQLAQYIDGDTSVGVPLYVGVAVGVEKDLRGVERHQRCPGRAVDGDHQGDGDVGKDHHPVAMPVRQCGLVDGAAAPPSTLIKAVYDQGATSSPITTFMDLLMISYVPSVNSAMVWSSQL